MQDTINLIQQVGAIADAISATLPSIAQAIGVVVGTASTLAAVFPKTDAPFINSARNVVNLLALNVGWAANKH